jgi:MFS family permease
MQQPANLKTAFVELNWMINQDSRGISPAILEQRLPELDLAEIPAAPEVDDTATDSVDSQDPLPEETPDPPKPSDLTGFGAVLANPSFLTLWSGQVFSQLADKVFLVLMILLISTHFQESGQSISRWVSSMMVASTLPAILFGTLAGVYVDRWSKKLVLVGSNLLRGILVLLIPFLLWSTHTLEWGVIPVGFIGLLATTFAVSTLTQYFAPAEQAVLPLVVLRQQLLSANSLYTSTMIGSVVMGFAIGEPLLVLADHLLRQLIPAADFGPELVVGGSYLVAGTLLLILRTGEAGRDTTAPEAHIWEDIRIGLRYIRDTPVLRAALLQIVMLYSIFAALAVLAVRMAEILLKASQFGVLLAVAGIGMGLGALLIGHRGHEASRSHWGLYGSLGLAAVLATLAWTTDHLVPTLILIGLVGFFGAFVGIPMQTVIQEETPEDLRGKVFGLENNLINIALSLPLVLAGVAETYLGLSPVLIILATLAAISGGLTWNMARQSLSA